MIEMWFTTLENEEPSLEPSDDNFLISRFLILSRRQNCTQSIHLAANDNRNYASGCLGIAKRLTATAISDEMPGFESSFLVNDQQTLFFYLIFLPPFQASISIIFGRIFTIKAFTFRIRF